jgi:hypothetical protein
MHGQVGQPRYFRAGRKHETASTGDPNVYRTAVTSNTNTSDRLALKLLLACDASDTACVRHRRLERSLSAVRCSRSSMLGAVEAALKSKSHHSTHAGRPRCSDWHQYQAGTASRQRALFPTRFSRVSTCRYVAGSSNYKERRCVHLSQSTLLGRLASPMRCSLPCRKCPPPLFEQDHCHCWQRRGLYDATIEMDGCSVARRSKARFSMRLRSEEGRV